MKIFSFFFFFNLKELRTCICEQLCDGVQAVAGHSPKKNATGKNPSLAGSVNLKVQVLITKIKVTVGHSFSLSQIRLKHIYIFYVPKTII